MRALLQRVSEAKVVVDGETTGSVKAGLLVLLAVHEQDTEVQAERLAEKILHLRIFPDERGKMNLSVVDVKGEILIVSQFTLYGDTSKGTRPSYSHAAPPEQALRLYETFVTICHNTKLKVATGRFQASMQVHLVNDGPVTLLCEVES
ncbi:MAG: D-aminoacyl-tRNA deacylase [Bryobacteraceae bacterium]